MAGIGPIRITKFKTILLGFLVLFITLYLNMKSHKISNLQFHFEQYTELHSSRLSAGETELKPKKILIWNKYWDSEALWNKLFSQILNGKCETPKANNCVFTLDKNEENSSHAILFHLQDLHPDYSFPDMRSRNPNTIWIAMNYEPPFVLSESGIHFSKFNGIFNRTMSYKRDSDIVIRHGKIVKFSQNGSAVERRYVSAFPAATGKNTTWINSRDDIKTRNYAGGKRRLIAWFVSHCNSQSGRENYIRELQKYVEVDVYGKCGKFTCGSKKSIRSDYRVEFDDCYYLVSVGYKFIIAFENSICEDYVTEKLYNNLKLNVVPVVFGGANYSEVAPPHSVIDASAYSPKELAEFLLTLDYNDTLYNEFFAWKKDHFIQANDGVPLACELCDKLNDPIWSSEKKVYEHLGGWITSDCSSGYNPV